MNFFKTVYHKIFDDSHQDLPVSQEQDEVEVRIEPEPKFCVVAFGNVLLDFSIEIPDTEVLERYGLPLETKGIIDADTLTTITEEVFSSKWKTDVHPGGSALNTVRILKQLGTKTSFYGAVGSDNTADLIRQSLDGLHIDYDFQVDPSTPTGKCVCFVYGAKTALYANIGASEKFSTMNMKEEIFQTDMDTIFYIEGFFIPERMDVCEHIVSQCSNKNKVLALNLNASFIVESHFENVEFIARNSLFVFGNLPEFQTFANESGYVTVEEFAKHFISRSNDYKIFVITNGAEYVELITNYNRADVNDVTIKRTAVPVVGNIVDTTGAGDSFVAGFLHAFLMEKNLDDCMANALNVASVVVQKFGCSYI